MMITIRRAFTLVEVLIVVVILGILSAMVVPQFSSATEDSKRQATIEQLRHLRNALDVYSVQHNGAMPDITAGAGTWGQLNDLGYLRRAPTNRWVGGDNSTVIILADAADAAFTTDYGWIYRAPGAAGPPMIWAAGFDGDDVPLPRP